MVRFFYCPNGLSYLLLWLPVWPTINTIPETFCLSKGGGNEVNDSRKLRSHSLVSLKKGKCLRSKRFLLYTHHVHNAIIEQYMKTPADNHCALVGLEICLRHESVRTALSSSRGFR